MQNKSDIFCVEFGMAVAIMLVCTDQPYLVRFVSGLKYVRFLEEDVIIRLVSNSLNKGFDVK